MKRPRPSHALQFILLMGLVSLLSDMTHEGARSLVGPFLSMTGASAANIGFVLGLGELLGTSLILLTAYIADQTKQYWLMTFMGYAINLIVIPSLALVPENGWIFACGLLLIERIGRAIRKPSKSTLVSFASKEMGEGKSFAILEFVDQIGAFLGPVLLFVVLWFKGEGTHLEAYHLAFFILGIPALLTLLVLWVAFKKFPHPEQFEKEEVTQDQLLLKKDFTFYLIAVALFAFGFIDFPIISMHFLKLNLIPFSWIPLLYACAMLVDAFAALIFGVGFDRFGLRILMVSTFISMPFAFFAFGFNSIYALILGVILWGIGMGAQESILKAAVAKLMPKAHRSMGFGLFELVFGVAWFMGSWFLGYLYDTQIEWMIAVSVGSQLLALPFFYFAYQKTIK